MKNINEQEYSIIFLITIGLLSLITYHDFSTSRSGLNIFHIFLFITFLPGIFSVFALMNPVTILVFIYYIIKNLIKKKLHIFNIYAYILSIIGALLICNFPSSYNDVYYGAQDQSNNKRYKLYKTSNTSYGISTITILSNDMHDRNFCYIPQYAANNIASAHTYTIHKTFVTRQCSYVGTEDKNIYLFEFSYIAYVMLGLLFLYAAHLLRQKASFILDNKQKR